MSERIQKIIAQAGICSRREAEKLIEQGEVTVNGKVAKLGDKANFGDDAIKVRGKLIHKSATPIYYMIFKPKNVICAFGEDEEGRSTLSDTVHGIKERVFTVGKLDYGIEGLVIATNDGALSEKIQKSKDLIRRFEVKTNTAPDAATIAKLARGGRVEESLIKPFQVRVSESFSKNALVEIAFKGMTSVALKKFFENKGLRVERIRHVGLGHLSIGKLAPGQFTKIEKTSIDALFAQPELAEKKLEKLAAKKVKIAPSAKPKLTFKAKKLSEISPSTRYAPKEASKKKPARVKD